MTLVRKAGINLAGLIVPVIFGFALFPIVIGHYGEERFGILTIMWILVSYSGIVDLGISRATVREVGAAVGTGDEQRIRRTVAMAHALGCLVGLALGACVLVIVGVAASRSWMSIGPELEAEVVHAAPYLAALLPFVSGAAVLRGEMEGRQWFGWASVLRASTGMAIFAVPLGAGIFGNGLGELAMGFLLVRVLVWGLSWMLLSRLLGSWVQLWPKGWSGLGALASQGGWMTITYVIAPLLAHIDRFVLLSFAGAAAVAYYSTANELISKLWLVPTAATAVLFPEFARRLAVGADVATLFARGQKLISALMCPVLMLLAVAAVPLLALWLGLDFAGQTAPAVKILCVGMMISCLSQIPATACLSAGGARGVAIQQSALLLAVLPALVFAAQRWGAIGVAWVWVGRMLVDQWTLLWLVGRVKSGLLRSSGTSATFLPSILGSVCVFAAGWASYAVAIPLLLVVGIACAYVLLTELPRMREV